MLHLVPDMADDTDIQDLTDTTSALYDLLYETPPSFVTQLMALTPCAPSDPRSPARNPLPVYRAPLTHPLSDSEQFDALLLDCERYENSITAVIRATGAHNARPTPTPIHPLPRRDYTPLPPASGDDHVILN